MSNVVNHPVNKNPHVGINHYNLTKTAQNCNGCGRAPYAINNSGGCVDKDNFHETQLSVSDQSGTWGIGYDTIIKNPPIQGQVLCCSKLGWNLATREYTGSCTTQGGCCNK